MGAIPPAAPRDRPIVLPVRRMAEPGLNDRVTQMSHEVEGRRDFILKHRANVEDIDYGS